MTKPEIDAEGLIDDERLGLLIEGFTTWSKTASTRPQLDRDVASALKELRTYRATRTSEAAEPVAWLTEWTRDGEEWVNAHANEVTALDEARANGGTCTPLYASPVLPTPTDEDVERVRLAINDAIDTHGEFATEAMARAALAAFMKKEG